MCQSLVVGAICAFIVISFRAQAYDAPAAARDWKLVRSADTLEIYSNDNHAGFMIHLLSVDSSTEKISVESRLHIVSNGLSDAEMSNMEYYEKRLYGFDGNLIAADQELKSPAGSNSWRLARENPGEWGLSVTAGGTTKKRQLAQVMENLNMTYALVNGIKFRTIRVGDVFRDTTIELITGQGVFSTVSCIEVPSVKNKSLWVFLTVNNITDRKERWELDTNGNTIFQENFPYVFRRRTDTSVVLEGKNAPALFETFTIPASRAAAGNERIGLVLDSLVVPDSSVSRFYAKNGKTWVLRTIPALCPEKALQSAADSIVMKFTVPTTTMQSSDERIKKIADSLVKGKKDRCDSVRSCFEYVYKTLKKKYSPTFSNALETLAAGYGDCGEHAVLLGALLRAVQIPARVVLGLVYMDTRKGYLYHAWVTAYAGGGTWVFVDPALGVFQATRDRVPLVIDDTGSAVMVIAKMLGRIRIEYVKK